jgi:ubiquinone/menaquinone biosynthesis C-methylase UbiE
MDRYRLKLENFIKNTYLKHLCKEKQNVYLAQHDCINEKLLELAKIQPGETILESGTGSGLFTLSAFERYSTANSFIMTDISDKVIKINKELAALLELPNNSLNILQDDITRSTLLNESANVIILKSVLVRIRDKERITKECYRLLKPGGRLVIFEYLASKTTRFYELLNINNLANLEKFIDAEESAKHTAEDPYHNFTDKSLCINLHEAGFRNIETIKDIQKDDIHITPEVLEHYFTSSISNKSNSYRDKLGQYLIDEEINVYLELLKRHLSYKVYCFNTPAVFFKATKV